MPNKAIFLDRDNTLIDDPGYINDPDQVKLLEGVPEALKEMRALGYRLVVTTNQSAVARGIVTEEVLKKIHARLETLLEEKGARLDRIYYCPYHAEGAVPKYRKDSEWRKPNPGMILQACREMDLDVSESWCIGDRQMDIEAGRHAGCHTILIDLMSPVGRLKPDQVRPDYIAVNIREAANIVKKHRRANAGGTAHPTETPSRPAAHASGDKPAEPEPAVPAQGSTKVETAPPAREIEPDPAPETPGSPVQTETLLLGIHEQLKSMQREELFDDFSVVRLVGGIAQIGVFFCLLIAVWFLLSPDQQTDPILFALGFALVLQMMSLTFAMHGRK